MKTKCVFYGKHLSCDSCNAVHRPCEWNGKRARPKVVRGKQVKVEPESSHARPTRSKKTPAKAKKSTRSREEEEEEEEEEEGEEGEEEEEEEENYVSFGGLVIPDVFESWPSLSLRQKYKKAKQFEQSCTMNLISMRSTREGWRLKMASLKKEIDTAEKRGGSKGRQVKHGEEDGDSEESSETSGDEFRG